MRIIPFIFLTLPLMYVIIGWAFGFASIRRFVVLLFVWVLTWEVMAFYALFGMTTPQGFPDPRGFGVAVVCMLVAFLGPLVAALMSSRLTPLERPPVVVAAEVYQGLDPQQKEQLHKGARVATKFAAKHFGNYLRDKGYTRTGDATQQFGRLL